MIGYLRSAIKPVVTLSHFEMPHHLVTEYGGFRSRKVLDAFVKFAKIVMARYQHQELEVAFKLPVSPQNDANCAALAEKWRVTPRMFHRWERH